PLNPLPLLKAKPLLLPSLLLPLITNLLDEDTAMTSSADSKYATKPSLKEKLVELKKEAEDLSVLFTFMDFDDPKYLDTKNRLDMYAEKIRTLEKPSTKEDQGAVNPRLLAQIPIFQLPSHAKLNPNLMTFDPVASFIRKFEKVMDLYKLDLDQQWKPYLSYAMTGEDVDIWFTGQLGHNPINGFIYRPCQ
ncbi:unnamed protein product, partial [Absidia cylindrospora]